MRTREAAPRDWAATQDRLGYAYRDRAIGERVANFDMAVAFFERALEVWTSEAAPLEWSASMSHLASTHRVRMSEDYASYMVSEDDLRPGA